MSLTTLIRWVLMVVCMAAICGCNRESPSQEQEQETVKTAEQYKAEADEQIDANNASEELQKLEQSINQEAAEVQ